jgi:hypothetical protein
MLIFLLTSLILCTAFMFYSCWYADTQNTTKQRLATIFTDCGTSWTQPVKMWCQSWSFCSDRIQRNVVGRQSHQDVKVFWHFRDWLRPHLECVLVLPSHQQHPKDADRVSPWNFWKTSHLDTSVCPSNISLKNMVFKFLDANL